MSEAHFLSFLVPMIGAMMMMMSLEVDAQSTVDDDASCQSSTSDDAVINLIKTGFTDVKNVCGSRQQTCSVVDSSGLCEYVTHFMCLCFCMLVFVFVCLLCLFSVQIYSVSQKNPPLRFSGIFSQTVGNFLSKFYTPVICSYLR